MFKPYLGLLLTSLLISVTSAATGAETVSSSIEPACFEDEQAKLRISFDRRKPNTLSVKVLNKTRTKILNPSYIFGNLTDNYSNQYQTRTAKPTNGQRTILPGESQTVVVKIGDRLLPSASMLYLDLPANGVGNSNRVRVGIPLRHGVHPVIEKESETLPIKNKYVEYWNKS